MKIVFSGGGTLGSVTPLLAVAEVLRIRDSSHEFFWIGTERGVEHAFVRQAGIESFTIPAGKLRRYFSFATITDLLRAISGFFAATAILKKIKPDVVVAAGGFVSVPVHFAAARLGIPQIIHQQDAIVGLATKLMSLTAKKITAALPVHARAFGRKKITILGNPVRFSIMNGDADRATERFHLSKDLATVFIVGGGTGAEALNQAVQQMLTSINGQFQVIHLTGMLRERPQNTEPWYHPYPFFTREMADAYAIADIIVSRAGFNALSEISAWGRPAIFIPMPKSHQEDNARFAEQAGAAVILPQSTLSGNTLLQTIRDIFTDNQKYRAMSDAMRSLLPHGAAERFADVIENIVERHGG